METWDGEAELSFAFSGQGVEYMKITLPGEKEVTPEESGEIQRQLRERAGCVSDQLLRPGGERRV